MIVGDALVVEDNVIIAMEAEHLLLSLGARQCHVASSLSAGLDLARTVDPVFVLLDVNLGAETSAPIAAYLRAQAIPYVVASGYGEVAGAGSDYGDAPMVTKPYTHSQLINAITRAIEQRTL